MRALDHRLLSSPDPDPGIVVLLVGLVFTLGVADLTLEVSLVLLVEEPEAVPVGPLGVGVDVHLDDAVLDGGLDLLLGCW